MGGPERRRLLLVAPAVIGLALATAACGGGSARAGVASVGTTTTAVPAGAAATGGSSSNGDPVKYARCMRSHGVLNFPDPSSAAAPSASRALKEESTSPEFQAAALACAKYAHHGTAAPPVSPQEMQKLLAVSRCMRAHGVPNFPDPNPTTGDLTAPVGIDRSSPTVLAALRACYSLAQAAGLGPPSTGQ